MKSRTISLILALCMLLCMFAGCAGDSQAEPSDAQPQASDQAASQAPQESETPEAPADAEPEAEPEPEPDPNEGLTAGDEGYDWSVFQPVTTDPVTLSMFYTQPPMLSAIVDVPSDLSYVYQKLEELTGVTIEFTMINMMNAATDFSLMMAAGDMCDIVNDAARYYASPDLAHDEGACIDILEYTDQMPNFVALMEEYPVIQKDLLTDAGYIINFPNITMPFETKADAGMLIRQDWLTELGLDLPKSYDQYHDVLAAFKAEYDISSPYVMPYNVLSPWGLFAGGFGLALVDGDNNFYIDNGQMALGTVSDAYYDYLSMFRDWYVEGLINSDFMSFMENLPDQTLITSGQTGLWFSDTTYIKTYESLMGEADPSCVLELAADPGMDEDYSGYIGRDNTASVANGGFSVSENCDTPEIAIAWCDYWYDPALSQFINYGYQGVTFEYDEDGVPQLGGIITDNEYGLTTRLASGLYLCVSGGFLNMVDKFNSDYTDLQKNAEFAWEIVTVDPSTITTETLPRGFSLNAEESSDLSVLMADINTYVTESALKFVTGDIELNQQAYEAYKQDIQSMGLDEVFEIMDGAYEEFLAENS